MRQNGKVWDLRQVQPRADLRRRHLARLLRHKLVLQVGHKLRGGRALESVIIEPAAQKSIKRAAPELRFQPGQEENAAFIRHGAVALIGILGRAAAHQRPVDLTQMTHVILKVAKSYRTLHVATGLPELHIEKPESDVLGKSLIEPEVIPAS